MPRFSHKSLIVMDVALAAMNGGFAFVNWRFGNYGFMGFQIVAAVVMLLSAVYIYRIPRAG